MRPLRVLAERDPGVVSRVLERFSNLSLIALRFTALCDADNQIVIEIDVAEISGAPLDLIAAKIGQLPVGVRRGTRGRRDPPLSMNGVRSGSLGG